MRTVRQPGDPLQSEDAGPTGVAGIDESGGAQLRLTDVDGHRITAFATNTRGEQLPTWSCGIVAGPAPKTESEPPRTLV